MATAGVRPSGLGEAGGTGGAMHAWGLLMAHRRRRVFAVWAVLIAAGLVFVPRFSSALSNAGLWVPASESSRTAALLASELPAAGGTQAVLVFTSPALTVADPGFQRVVAATARAVRAVPGVTGVEVPAGAAARALTAPGGHTALGLVALGGDEGEAERLAPQVAAAAEAQAAPAVRVGVTGEPAVAHDLFGFLQGDVYRADAVGVPVALLVLLVVFGSLVAAGLPLLLALASLGVSLGGLGAYSMVTGTGFNMTMESATVMLALGIGIDYALFIVTRFREELATGAQAAPAVAVTTATAGRTVLVSGSTVVVALAPVLLVNDPMMRDIVIGPMVAVTVLLAAALTLLPAALAGLGSRVSLLAPPLPRWARRGSRRASASRLTALLLRRPLAVLAAVTVVLGGLSVFTLGLHTGLDYGLGTLRDTSSGRAAASVTAAFGPGAVSPVQVVFTTAEGSLTVHDLQAVADFGARLGRDREVASVTSLPVLTGGPAAAASALAAARADPALAATLSPVVNAAHGGTLTLMTVTPRDSFDSAQATQLVGRIRQELPAALQGTGLHALVGGASAAITDLSAEISAKTPLVIALILAVALLLLAAAFRSPAVALIGLAGTMLSVGAAYGLLVLVFQEGAGQPVFGFTSPGFIQDWLPLLLFAVLVGLSTDYQVFLISRVREEWERGHDAAGAIAAGLRRSGPVILSAATIMVIVFASFLLARVFELKELGFALAVVVLLDAAVTRRLLVPAALRLLGRRAWDPLERREPHPGR